MALAERGLAQTYMPLILNERGDTLQYTWPIPDSLLCIKDEIIIKFKSNGLFLNKLCYDFEDSINPNLAVDGGEVLNYAYYERVMAIQQMFLLDSIIADPALLLSMKSLGGIYLTRISLADPCHDTLSITRFGDTIKSATYLYMKLKLNNDTSLINACIFLTYFHQNALDLAEPNYCYEFNRTPVDTYFHGANYMGSYLVQESLKDDQSNAQKAWDYQTGSKDIKVAVIDAGIDCFHCDLGGNFGKDHKVIDGLNYYNNNFINSNSSHGTKVASIIGALTNGATSACPNTGIAGIAGGWMGDEGNPTGCSLIALKISDEGNFITQDDIAGAILDAAAQYQDNRESFFGAHILNCSWDGYNYSETIRSALNFAYEHGVSIVCSKGNNGEILKPSYPNSYDPNWITSVGGHTSGDPMEKWEYSNYGNNMDLLAPSMFYDIATAKNGGGWFQFGMTSAAAPHVSGAIALLRSEFLNKTKYPDIAPEPEDYENMLKVVAVDLNYYPENSDEKLRTKVGYDNVTGWGQLKIGEIFEKLADGYRLYHYKITYDPLKPFYYSDFSDELGSIVVAKNGKREDSKIGTYKSAKQRTVSGTINLPEEFLNDNEHKLYVWGRNGRTNKGGLDKIQFLELPDETKIALPLYFTSYTQVTSGLGGNGIVDGIVIPLNSRTVTAQTYQYKLKKDSQSEEIIVPTNENIELYFSVFGKKIPSSVNTGEIEENSSLIFPNPVKDYLEIGANKKLNFDDNTEINIYNVIGEIMVSTNYEDGINIRMNVAHLTPGIYFLKIGSHVEKFIKI